MNIKTIAEHGVEEAELGASKACQYVGDKLIRAVMYLDASAYGETVKLLGEAKALVESIKAHVDKDEKPNDLKIDNGE